MYSNFFSQPKDLQVIMLLGYWISLDLGNQWENWEWENSAGGQNGKWGREYFEPEYTLLPGSQYPMEIQNNEK